MPFKRHVLVAHVETHRPRHRRELRFRKPACAPLYFRLRSKMKPLPPLRFANPNLDHPVGDSGLDDVEQFLRPEIDAQFDARQHSFLLGNALDLVGVAPPRRVELEARQLARRRDRSGHGNRIVDEDHIDRRIELRRVLPPVRQTELARMGKGRGRHEITRGVDAGRKQARDAARAAARRSVQRHDAGDDVGIGLARGAQDRREMGRIPDVVMAEIGDKARPRRLQPVIVDGPLRAMVAREIVPADARVAEIPHHLLAVVGAAIADHENLEVLHGLEQDGADREAKRRAPVVGRDDDRDRRRL